jgi:3-oxoacyl-[acyl-carrier protein] reductase
MTTTRSGRPIPTYPDLAGKVAVVTGGSRGIGADCCRMLAANGAKVAINARSQAGIETLVRELSAGGADVVGVAGDCTRLPDLMTLHDQVAATLGPPDILLAYAGGFESLTPITEITQEEWVHVLDANLTSAFLSVKAFLPTMIERRSGAIVTMASNGGRLLDKMLTASYAASKAGVIQFTRHVAREVGQYGIRVNSIAPATVMSERVAGIMDEQSIARTAAMSPLGRIGTTEDCALATLFLVSDAAAWLTGVTLDVAGGRVMI